MLGYRHDAFQVAHDVRYYAHAAPSLAAGPPRVENGQAVHLWGTLPGPAADGRVVILQANVLGSRRWITFRRATTDDAGKFKAAYRFRAIVPRQDHYPYVEGHSAPASVLVHPHRRHHHRRSQK